MKVIQVSARVDPSIKESAQKVFERQGLDMEIGRASCRERV